MANLWILLPAILISVFFPLPQSAAPNSSIDYRTSSSCSDQQNQNSLTCELEEAKLRITRLESIFEEKSRDVNGKNQYLRDCEEKIEKLTLEIDRLKIELSSYGDDSLRANQKLSALEEEARLLWAASRKINFEIHALEQKALEAERKLQDVTSQVGKMTEIVSEQWIQVQQLEQAVHMAELRTSKFKKELLRRCRFLKFFIDLFDDFHKILKGILHPYVPGEGSLLFFCKSKSLQLFSATQHYHRQLQGFIMHAMKSNELTEAIAHEEVVFFMASAVVAFPLMASCMLLLT